MFIMEKEIEKNVEMLYEQLFGKYSIMNVSENDKKAIIRTLLTNIIYNEGCK